MYSYKSNRFKRGMALDPPHLAQINGTLHSDNL